MIRDIFKNVFGPSEPEQPRPSPLGMNAEPEHPTPELLSQIPGSALIVDSVLKKQGAEESLPSREKMQKPDAADRTDGTVVYLNKRRRFPSKIHAQQGMDDDDPGPSAA
jgi:hypothetical protein